MTTKAAQHAGRRPRAVGDRWQRECVKELKRRGYEAWNIGTKGAAGPFDVLAWPRSVLGPGRILLVQVKYAGNRKTYRDAISMVRRELAGIHPPDADVVIWMRYNDEWEIIDPYVAEPGANVVRSGVRDSSENDA